MKILDRNLFFLSFFILCSTALYGHTLYYEWFIFDDYFHILGNSKMINPGIRDFIYYWTNASSKIPITYNTWQLISKFFGQQEAWAFRLINILIHGFNTFLLFRGTSELLKKVNKDTRERNEIYEFSALMGALFFLVHPVQVESVVWISSLKGVLAALFSLLSFNFYLEEKGGHRKKILFKSLMVICLLLSVASKPSMVVLPFVFIIFDIFAFKVSLKKAFREQSIFILFGVAIVVLQVSEYRLDATQVKREFFKKFILINLVFTKYLQLLVMPINQLFDYQQNYNYVENIIKHHHITLRISLGVSFLYCWGIIYSLLKKKKQLIGALLLVFLILISVNLGIVSYNFQQISTSADRYLYFPIVAFSMMISLLLFKFREGQLGSKLLIAFVSIYYLFFIYQTYQTSLKWKNNESFFSSHSRQNVNTRAVVEPLLNSFIKEKKSREAFKLFVKNNMKFGKDRSDLANAILTLLGEQNLSKEGNLLIKIAKINAFDIDLRNMIEYHIQVSEFSKAEEVLNAHSDELNLLAQLELGGEISESRNRKLYEALKVSSQHFFDNKSFDKALKLNSFGLNIFKGTTKEIYFKKFEDKVNRAIRAMDKKNSFGSQ